MTGFVIALMMVTVTLIAMAIDLTDLQKQVKASIKQYNELKKWL